MDVIEIDAASKTGVEDIREIIDNIKYKPVSCKYKIYVIDEVHMLSKNAFNALLKTLEEPPSHIKFIFATTEAKKIPITIISRCQRFDLHRVEISTFLPYLLSIAKKENVNINEDAMALIVRAAEGSVRDGLSLLDQAIVNGSGEITANSIILMLGLADRGKVYDLIDSIFKGDAPSSLDIFQKLYKSGADVLMIFDEMLKITHFLTQLKISPEIKDNIYIPEIERKKGYEMTKQLTMFSLGRFWQVLFKGYQELQFGSHLYQLGEMIIIRLIFLYDGPSPEELTKKIEQELENIEQTKPVSQNNIENSTPKTINFKNEIEEKKVENNLATSKIIHIESFRQFVDLFYQKRESMLYTHLYNSIKLISFKDGEIVINTNTITDPSFSRTIARCISKWTGRIWQVTSSKSNVGKTLKEEDIIIQQKEIELMKNDTDVKSIFKMFPGTTIHSITPIAETSDEKNYEEEEQQIKGE